MAKIKLTKSTIDAAQSQTQASELRDKLVPGFLCKVTPFSTARTPVNAASLPWACTGS